MKTLFPTLALVLISMNLHASDWSFNYLKKLYEKDVETCYKRCETIMNLFPNQESAYFFAMKVQVKEAQTVPKTKSKSVKLVKALDYAKHFDKNASSELKSLTEWDTVQDYLFGMAADLRQKLDDENLNSNVKQLDEKWKKFTGNSLKPKTNYSIVKTEAELISENTAVSANDENETKETSTISGVMLNGMPKGTENIVSSDFQGEKELLILINKERKRQKMDTLVWNPDLARACRYHAMDMGTQDYFDHDSYDLKNGKLIEAGDTFDRIRAFYSSSFVNSENIAAGNSSAEGTYNQWYNSPGHYANMFNKSSKKVGIGVVEVPGSEWGFYWVFCTAE